MRRLRRGGARCAVLALRTEREEVVKYISSSLSISLLSARACSCSSFAISCCISRIAARSARINASVILRDDSLTGASCGVFSVRIAGGPVGSTRRCCRGEGTSGPSPLSDRIVVLVPVRDANPKPLLCCLSYCFDGPARRRRFEGDRTSIAAAPLVMLVVPGRGRGRCCLHELW